MSVDKETRDIALYHYHSFILLSFYISLQDFYKHWLINFETSLSGSSTGLLVLIIEALYRVSDVLKIVNDDIFYHITYFFYYIW